MSDLDLITFIIQRVVEALSVLNSYKVGGFGLIEILIIFLLLSVLVPIFLRLAGYDIGDDD